MAAESKSEKLLLKTETPALSLNNVSFRYPLRGKRKRRVQQRQNQQGIGGLLGSGKNKVEEILALKEISLTIHRGERLGLMGHNGAGKSTLLRVMAGIYPPQYGSVKINGRVAPLFNASSGMDPELSGYENIFLRGYLLGRNQKEIQAVLPDIEAFCELGSYLSMPMKIYSPGMKARLGFAVSTTFDYDILLLDEWLGVGDKNFKGKAQKRMAAFYERAGTVILATHNESLMKSYCNRALVLEKGQVVDKVELE